MGIPAGGLRPERYRCYETAHFIPSGYRHSGYQYARHDRSGSGKTAYGQQGTNSFYFLTAYDEFSYAQTALQIGAFDYLLKPLDNEALKAILLRAGEKLDRERQTAVMRRKLRSDYENWAGHLLLDGINGVTRSVTELEEMLQQEWRPAGYELMLVSSADFLSPERIEQLTDQIRQCLSGQEALYQFKYVHTRIK